MNFNEFFPKLLSMRYKKINLIGHGYIYIFFKSQKIVSKTITPIKSSKPTILYTVINSQQTNLFVINF